MKIAILGYSGSGKSTLAKKLAGRYDIPVLHLDTVQYLPNWQLRDEGGALAIVSEFMERESWIIDGNYSSFLQEERLNQADCIIFMDFPRFACLFRVLKRYFQYRGMSRDSMADGCIEKMDLEFAWWVFHKGRTGKKRAYYREVTEKHRAKTVVLKNQRELDEFILRQFKAQE
ncbi:MAG: DNA topology modulation protein [Oscillospiraceae bacterium]